MANLSTKFTVDGYLMAASNAANSYVHLLADNESFMICAIVVAIWAAHMASQGLLKDEVLESMGAIIDSEASKIEITDTLFERKPKSNLSVLKNKVPGSVGASKDDKASKDKCDNKKEQ